VEFRSNGNHVHTYTRNGKVTNRVAFLGNGNQVHTYTRNGKVTNRVVFPSARDEIDDEGHNFVANDYYASKYGGQRYAENPNDEEVGSASHKRRVENCKKVCMYAQHRHHRGKCLTKCNRIRYGLSGTVERDYSGYYLSSDEAVDFGPHDEEVGSRRVENCKKVCMYAQHRHRRGTCLAKCNRIRYGPSGNIEQNYSGYYLSESGYQGRL
jgi:hypothetical protein